MKYRFQGPETLPSVAWIRHWILVYAKIKNVFRYPKTRSLTLNDGWDKQI